MPNLEKFAAIRERITDKHRFRYEGYREFFVYLYRCMYVEALVEFVPELLECVTSQEELEEVIAAAAAATDKSGSVLDALRNNVQIIRKILEGPHGARLMPTSLEQLLMQYCERAIKNDNVNYIRKIVGHSDVESLLALLKQAVSCHATNIASFIFELENVKNDPRARALLAEVANYFLERPDEIDDEHTRDLKVKHILWIELIIKQQIPIPAHALIVTIEADKPEATKLLLENYLLISNLTPEIMGQVIIYAAGGYENLLKLALELYHKDTRQAFAELNQDGVTLPDLTNIIMQYAGADITAALFRALKAKQSRCVGILAQYKELVDCSATDKEDNTLLMVLMNRSIGLNYNIENFVEYLIKNSKLTFTDFVGRTVFFNIHQGNQQYLPGLLNGLYAQLKIDEEAVDITRLTPYIRIDTTNLSATLNGLFQSLINVPRLGNLTVVKFLLACNPEFATQEFEVQCNHNEKNYQLSLLDCAAIANNLETYKFLRAKGVRHRAHSLVNLIQFSNSYQLAEIYLYYYLKDQQHSNLSPLLSRAIMVAAANNYFLVTQLTSYIQQRNINLAKDDLLTSFSSERTASPIVLQKYPFLDHFISEFFIRRCGLNMSSHYWRNRQAHTPVSLAEILEHMRGLHTRQHLGGLFSVAYSGHATAYRMHGYLDHEQYCKILSAIGSSDENMTAIAEGIHIELTWAGRNDEFNVLGEFNALRQEISTYLAQQAANPQIANGYTPTLGDLQDKFEDIIDWEKDVEVTSWSRAGISGFFAGGKIKMSLQEYVKKLKEKDREKYIKICSAQDKQELIAALGRHRLGFWGETTGKQIYNLVKKSETQPAPVSEELFMLV